MMTIMLIIQMTSFALTGGAMGPGDLHAVHYYMAYIAYRSRLHHQVPNAPKRARVEGTLLYFCGDSSSSKRTWGL
jgi:hypothetical protein